ncbi:MAG: hypothetical protein AAB955_03420 [Patescibacteria group bacterium]
MVKAVEVPGNGWELAGRTSAVVGFWVGAPTLGVTVLDFLFDKTEFAFDFELDWWDYEIPTLIACVGLLFFARYAIDKSWDVRRKSRS